MGFPIFFRASLNLFFFAPMLIKNHANQLLTEKKHLDHSISGFGLYAKSIVCMPIIQNNGEIQMFCGNRFRCA